MRLAEAIADLQDKMDERIDKRIAEEWQRANSIHEQFAYKGHEHVEVSRLINVLEGTPRQMPSGETVRDGGVLNEIQTLTETISQNGVKIKIPPGVWAAIWGAVITGLFSLAVAIITSPSPW